MRLDPQVVGDYWLMGEMYDPNKMCHSHEVKPCLIAEKPKLVFEEEQVDTDADSYGDEDMGFKDKDPVAQLPDSQKDSPISDEFEQNEKL